MTVDTLARNNLKIGNPVWAIRFDSLAYMRSRDVADQLIKYFIVGENRASWLIGSAWQMEHGTRGVFSYKIDKKTFLVRKEKNGGCGYGPPKFLFSEIETQGWIYVHKFRHVIADAVRKCEDATILQHIASIVGVAGA